MTEGSKKHPKTNYTQWAEVLADLQSRYPEYKSIAIQDGSATVSTATYGNTRGSDRYSFDPATGKITEIQLYKDLPKSAKIRGWIYSVHAGTWGGIGNPDIELPGFALRGCLCHNRLLFLAQEETPEVHTKVNQHKHASLAVMHSFAIAKA